MKFSNQQKLIVTLLTEIHAKLEIADGLDPEFVQRMVAGGYGWALSWKYPGVFTVSGDMPEAVKYVEDVLDMWAVLEMSFASLDLIERKMLDDATDPFTKELSFPGFDYIDEYEYLSIAKILIDDLNRWSEFKDRIANTHMHTSDGYLRMLSIFNEVRARRVKSRNYGLLGVQSLAEILNARLPSSTT